MGRVINSTGNGESATSASAMDSSWPFCFSLIHRLAIDLHLDENETGHSKDRREEDPY